MPVRGGSEGLRKPLARLSLAACAVALVYVFWLPEVEWLKTVDPKTTAYIDRYLERAREKGRPARVVLRWTRLAEMSPHLRNAVVISEDDMFYAHDGVDWESFRQAMDYNLRKRRFARGASTITQQTARNLFLSSSKNPLRKVKEMLLARKMERALGKRRILEIYLNIAEWGDGIYGAPAACRRYFDKAPAEVTVDGAVALAAALPSPRRLNPARKAGPRLLKRREVILERMRKAGYLPEA